MSLAILLSLLLTPAAHAATRSLSNIKIGPLKGVDILGQLHHFGDGERTQAIVVVFLSPRCSISNRYLPTVNRLASRYRRRGVEFYGVVTCPSMTRQQVAEHYEHCRAGFPVIFDATGELQRGFHARRASQAYVLDADGRLQYVGAIDGRHETDGRSSGKQTSGNHKDDYLAGAITAVLHAASPKPAYTHLVGARLPAVPDKTRDHSATFCRDIAPIIRANCGGCHRAGESAPFPLLSYRDVSKRARQIVEVTRTRYMPPWKPAPAYGHFRNEARLTKHELALLDDWYQSGLDRGQQADLPPTQQQTAGWPLGKPDRILQMSEVFEVPASGPDFRQYFVIPTRFRDQQMIRAIDFRPGSPLSVHHASFFLDPAHAARRLDAAETGPGYRGYGGPQVETRGTLQSWFPGRTARALPPGYGRVVQRDADIIAEIHYVCTGKPERDQSQIGLYYASRGTKRIVEEIQVGNKQICIPAGAKRHRETASYQLPTDTTLFDVTPHMHALGSEFKATALQPDGSEVPLIWIKDWDFNWQSQYAYAQPLRLPKGTKLQVEAWYDNSADNPLNPNSPPREVRWGDSSADEMLICHFQCTCDTRAELQRLINDYQKYFDAAQQQESAQAEPHRSTKPKPRRRRDIPFR